MQRIEALAKPMVSEHAADVDEIADPIIEEIRQLYPIKRLEHRDRHIHLDELDTCLFEAALQNLEEVCGNPLLPFKYRLINNHGNDAPMMEVFPYYPKLN